MVLGRHVSQSVLQRDDGVVAIERPAAVGRSPDPGLEFLGLRQLGQLDSQNRLGHLILRRDIVAPPVSVSAPASESDPFPPAVRGQGPLLCPFGCPRPCCLCPRGGGAAARGATLDIVCP